MAEVKQSALNVTPRAIEMIRKLRDERDLGAEYGLRVFVAGGGCSGMQYGMAFENNPMEDDTAIAADDVTLYVDPVSLPYIEGATVDFIDSMMGGGFKVDNPNAVSTCGCGSSFRAGDDAGAEGASCGSGGCGCG